MSGTTNYVTRWTDANTLGTSTIYDNGTNVGIGTASPSSMLHMVMGSSSGLANYVIIQSNSTQAYQGGILLNNRSLSGSYSLKISASNSDSDSAAAQFGYVINSDPGTFLNDGSSLEIRKSGNIILASSVMSRIICRIKSF